MPNVPDLDLLLPPVTVPPQQRGRWIIERFAVDKHAAMVEQLRATLNRDTWAARGAPPLLPGEYTRLVRLGAHAKSEALMPDDPWRERQVIMSDTPGERLDHLPFVLRAGGYVLINGLGLGMALHACLVNSKVRHTTVIEIDADVIAMVEPHYRALFPRASFEVIHADAFTWQPPKGRRYGAIWHDIWPDKSPDNLSEMARLHRKYGRRTSWQGSWGHADCLAMRAFGRSPSGRATHARPVPVSSVDRLLEAMFSDPNAR
jgi:hypothetical protein